MKTLKINKGKESQIPFVAKLTRENIRMMKRALKYASCRVGKDKRYEDSQKGGELEHENPKH